MKNKSKLTLCLKILVPIFTLAMIIINIVATSLPLNGLTTKDISDKYLNMFVPQGYTFMIWGLIYIFMILFSIYQLELLKPSKGLERFNLVRCLYILACILNIAWLLSFHYEIILLSTFIILGLLITLLVIYSKIRNLYFTKLGNVMVRIGFSLYLGWIIVATVANISTTLVFYNWNMFNAPEEMWMDLITIVAVAILFMTAIRYNDFILNVVTIWSLIGILVKQSEIYKGSYPGIVALLSVSLILSVVLEAFLILCESWKLRMTNYIKIPAKTE